MSKIKEKQREKEQKLLDTAFDLFISKGIHETTIQDIVKDAGVAKGTFYLYFRDKYDIMNVLTLRKTVTLFEEAIKSSHKINYKNFTEQFLFIIDYIINALSEDKKLLKFIYKNLSVGIYNTHFQTELKDNFQTNASKLLFEMFKKRADEDELNLPNPQITFFMIIELVGSTCYTSILFNSPVPIEEYKPYLYQTIEKILRP
ncbi:TetR family transcriptional regulator [Sporanaerobium hydrogeniformans]|uniref:TetR family transcriptional regulator n=1 Tax=Sporanaerobium hydrogeniformans TaxID=3072179 RepID=A0AC61DA57_9FIRM|nr:TetR/AcrR family transcriptional regulator [Sporanaerobium hydrogeniformans]PHV69948.1 TetR family transcriptional regulator [Sporanaerobium hydrogeniformans]